MRTSSRPRSDRAAERGFTLIELMVVVAIIGIASAAVVLTLPGDRAQVREQAERFALRVAGARDQAIVQARPIRIVANANGYAFERREQGRWQRWEDKPFVTTGWRDRVSAAGATRITFDSTGATQDAGAVTLSRDAARVRVVIDSDGQVRVDG